MEAESSYFFGGEEALIGTQGCSTNPSLSVS